MARFGGFIDPRTQDFERSAVAYSVDAIGISIGSLFGTPPVTAYIESGAGIAEGGATGITSLCSGLCFFIAIFFAPIFASIPPWATGPVLVIVGGLMTASAVEINWRYPGDAIPAFITIAVMPFTYSIAYGLIGGIMSYILLNGTAKLLKVISGGRIKPADEDLKDPWTYKIEGGFFPPWIQRLLAKRKGGKVDGVDPTPERSVGSSSGEGHVINMEGTEKGGAGDSRTGEVLSEKMA
jgi:AGZA family xanthine/uracil permease-like MFS transporter